MRLSSARIVVALVAPAGVVVGHALGYLATNPQSRAHVVSHSYLNGAAGVAAALALAAVAWAALSGARGRFRGAVRLVPLLGAQWVLFAGQELVEHALAGHGAGAVVHSPAVWLGLAAQALVALALTVLLRVAAVAGSRAVASTSRLAPRAPGGARWALPRSGWNPGCAVVTAVPARGPPSSLA